MRLALFFKIFSGAILLQLILPQPSLAEELNYNLYNFQASASEKVDNDLMSVVLSASRQATLAKEASDQVNQAMTWALKQVNKHSDIEARSEQYNSHPQYKSNRIVGWNVSQQLYLESSNFALLTDLVGKLQSRLHIQSMNFSAKETTRKATEDQLIAKALLAYKARAKIVAKTMNAKKYDLVNININTQNFYPPMESNYRTRDMMAGDIAPAVKAGESKVTVTVGGQIQLSF